MLNGLWLGFFLVAALAALGRWLIGGDPAVFAALVESLFAMAKLAVEVMIVLFGTLTLWLGFLRIAEKAEPGTVILSMMPDTGERYLSTPLFEPFAEDMDDEERALSESTPGYRMG